MTAAQKEQVESALTRYNEMKRLVEVAREPYVPRPLTTEPPIDGGRTSDPTGAAALRKMDFPEAARVAERWIRVIDVAMYRATDEQRRRFECIRRYAYSVRSPPSWYNCAAQELGLRTPTIYRAQAALLEAVGDLAQEERLI